MPKKFRKKPVVIEAIRWTGDLAGAGEVFDFAQETGGVVGFQGANLQIFTLEGPMLASPGDWIIRGVKGELYPCKPDIFAATYEEVA